MKTHKIKSLNVKKLLIVPQWVTRIPMLTFIPVLDREMTPVSFHLWNWLLTTVICFSRVLVLVICVLVIGSFLIGPLCNKQIIFSLDPIDDLYEW